MHEAMIYSRSMSAFIQTNISIVKRGHENDCLQELIRGISFVKLKVSSRNTDAICIHPSSSIFYSEHVGKNSSIVHIIHYSLENVIGSCLSIFQGGKLISIGFLVMLLEIEFISHELQTISSDTNHAIPVIP